MGSCVSSSVNKGKPGGFGLPKSGSKKDSAFVLPQSPFKDKIKSVSATSAATELPINSFHDLGSKDEMFFDSRAWLDSDCEDDFFSVNGDFTPSCGSTPVHHRVSSGSLQVNKTPLVQKPFSSVTEPSPTGKKRLSELFQDTAREELDGGGAQAPGSGRHNIGNGNKEAKPTILDVLPKSAQSTPLVSGANSAIGSERIANGDALLEEKGRSMKLVQCCLPSLVSCRGVSGRKTRMSPAIDVGGEA